MSESINPVVVDSFDYAVNIEEHVRVPLSDGVRLSVKLWKPVPREEGETFPVIMEAIPYRKDDVSLWDDSVRMAYFAGHGYLCARVDLRGSGDSEGVLPDEYSMREQLDLVEVVAWLADLPESNGNVGMTGISWSGFNSLQVAQHRPPALKAIVTVCSTDDRYDNDVHYMGGSVLSFYQNWWGSIMHEFNLRPADPRLVGDEWRSLQMERMSDNPQMTSIWLAHQNRDSYWKPGSVCENYDNIVCPVLAVGGWHDAYTDAIVRLTDRCTTVAQGVIGPWGHTWPERGVPGPIIGFLQVCLRWWDRWLKGVQNGAEHDPKMRYYLMEPCALTPDCSSRDGSWLQTECFTRGRPTASFAFGGRGTLEPSDAVAGKPAAGEPDAGDDGRNRFVSHCSALTVGTQVDTWLPMGSPIDLPSEQTADDEKSLVFDSLPLEEDLEVVGLPIVKLRVAADRPEAFVFARLCDVWPDGSSQLITRANLNLTHRDSHEFPEPLEPGTFYDVEIPLKAVAQRVPAGHRVRLALSTSYWPWIWPSRERATVTIDTVESALTVPIRFAGDEPLAQGFPEAQIARGESCETLTPGKAFAERTYDPDTGVMEYTRSADDESMFRTPSGFTFGGRKLTRYVIDENDPLSARMESDRNSVFMRDDWKIETRMRSVMTCTFDDFVVTTDTEVLENGREIHRESCTDTIPRCFN